MSQPGASKRKAAQAPASGKPGKRRRKHKELPEAEDVHLCIDGGLRRVRPYYYHFRTFTKRRWLGQTLLAVMSKEFQLNTPAYYEAAILDGRITVNDARVPTDLVLKDNMEICHRVHRHEPPVCAQPIRILAKTDDLVVIDKPPSIPVHPCGKYRHNSITSLLGHEHGLWNLKPCHRLDRLTSGVLLLGRTAEACQRMGRLIAEHSVQKEYLCRVVGRFPSTRVECAEPIKVVSPKLGVCTVAPDGKPCQTEFQLAGLFPDGTSLVACIPRTGRTHQIRVHLQFLGHPIVNDPLYNARLWAADATSGARKVKTAEEVQAVLDKVAAMFRAKSERFDTSQAASAPPRVGDPADSSSSTTTTTTTATTKDTTEATDSSSGTATDAVADPATAKDTTTATATDTDPATASAMGTSTGAFVDPQCEECSRRYPDPTPEENCLFLHARKYSGDGWAYETGPPDWAVGAVPPGQPATATVSERGGTGLRVELGTTAT